MEILRKYCRTSYKIKKIFKLVLYLKNTYPLRNLRGAFGEILFDLEICFGTIDLLKLANEMEVIPKAFCPTFLKKNSPNKETSQTD